MHDCVNHLIIHPFVNFSFISSLFNFKFATQIDTFCWYSPPEYFEANTTSG